MRGAELSLTKLKVSSEVRLAEETRNEQRKRNLIVLILHHLQSHGYLESVERLQGEANITLRKVSVADNIDLLSILQEYESYYAIKFGKPPKLVRKTGTDDSSPNAGGVKQRTPPPRHKSTEDVSNTSATSPAASLPKLGKGQGLVSKEKPPKPVAENGAMKCTRRSDSSNSLGSTDSAPTFGFDVVGTTFAQKKDTPVPPQKYDSQSTDASNDDLYANRLLKPMPEYGNSEFRELAAIITRDIFMKNPNVRWADIAGLEKSKRLVKEAVVYPTKYPDLFTGILSPWKGLLLYGPPGTGKTMLAKAVATECDTTFFNISASSIVSKWRGDSEKLVRVLFELARYHAPSTIFLDELESIMSQRTSDGAEHEGSRRMKTELLIQMDGLAKTDEHVFLLAASNLPWDLDMAMLRRLEKRILVDLPDAEARKAMFIANLPENLVDAAGKRVVGDLDYVKLATVTEGYSGSDIKLVCKEAAMRPLRKLFDMLDVDRLTDGDQGAPALMTRDPVTQHDVEEAIANTRPTGNSALEEKYRTWQRDFGPNETAFAVVQYADRSFPVLQI
ncbi:Katanin p60 ATPase-containing subunit A-like 2 [Borealophlyctis nickersoniae]|nr:Katanin p60 ATPase-containing subunit A-like 2 [Borealophlyctis nickersoniae]